MPEPPRVDPGPGWKLADRSEDRPFDVRVVSVVANTVVYEDADVAPAVRDEVGPDGTWRFFFASRLELSPEPPDSDALSRVVSEGAFDGFADRLRERGFERVERADVRDFPVGDVRARLVHYVGRCAFDRVELDVDGYAAVWPSDGSFLFAGGAYPTGVRTGDAPGADEVRAVIDPESFRSALLSLIRSVR